MAERVDPILRTFIYTVETYPNEIGFDMTFYTGNTAFSGKVVGTQRYFDHLSSLQVDQWQENVITNAIGEVTSKVLGQVNQNEALAGNSLGVKLSHANMLVHQTNFGDGWVDMPLDTYMRIRLDTINSWTFGIIG
jgi:hypothetical protein